MKEQFFSYEKSLLTLGTALLVFSLVGCNGSVAIDETHIWYGSERMRNDPAVVAHEECHQKQMRKVGGSDIFWYKYWNKDKTFRCQAEIECGADTTHFACQDFKFYIEDTSDKNTKWK